MDPKQMLDQGLKALAVRGVSTDTRFAYYEGRHECQLGSAAWNASYRRIVAGIIDNQVALVVDALADAIQPSAVVSPTQDPYAEAVATWATGLFDEEAEQLATAARHAETAGVQTVTVVDVNTRGQVTLYNVDPRSFHAIRNRAKENLGGVHVYKDDEDGYTSATVHAPEAWYVYTSTSKKNLPRLEEFTLTETIPNPYGECMFAVVDKGNSVVDRIKPLNDMLNKSLQTQAVVGEAYALPYRVYLGLETYDPETGEVSNVIPSMNPATGGRDISIPTVQDAEGSDRQVIQFASPQPSEYLAEQDSLRLSIARHGPIPPSMLQVGGGRPTGHEALEIEMIPTIKKQRADWRGHYREFYREVARLAARRYLFGITGRAVPAPELDVTLTELSASTGASRMEQFRTAVESGMTLADALVEFLGWSREAADLAQANSDTRAAEQAALADQRFEAGADLEV